MRYNNKKHTAAALLMSLALSAHAQSPAQHEPPRSHKILETVLVVAQKKEQSIQDVPISISVIGEEFIENWSITDLNTAVMYTPNVKIADAGYFILPRIRGFGTDQNNKAFEPPSGVAIDGIPYTRLEYFTSALFDIDRMEVYRGPQGTAFGKNTTAGLIHLITKSPTSEFSGRLDVQSGDFDRRRVEAAIGGPLIDDVLNFRVAVLKDERSGFVDNTAGVSLETAPRYGRGSDKNAMRIKLELPNLLGSSLLLSAEKIDLDVTGAGLELFNVSDSMKQALLRYDPATDFVRANYRNTINEADYRYINIETYNAEWKYELGAWQLTGIAGYSLLDGAAALDTDVGPAPAIAAEDSDTSPTHTAEFRIESPEFNGLLGLDNVFGLPLGQQSSGLFGLYYQKREINGDGIVYRFGSSYLDLFMAGNFDNPNSRTPEALAQLTGASVPAATTLLELSSTDSRYSEEVTQDFDQLAEAEAAFAQVQWQLTDSWGLEYGIRYSDESKSASFNQFYSSPPPRVILPVFGVDEYQQQLSRSEINIAHRLALNFEPSDDIGIFLHVARGFRSGGYNAFSFRGELDELQYEPESATDLGLDIKTTLLDGRMRLNVSLFKLDVDDFQVLVGVANERGFGVGSNKVENAARARSQGIEGDLTWLVTDWFTLFATLGVNDTKYLSFTNNSCFPDNQNTDGDDDPRCDATGKPFPLTPEYTGTMLGMATIPLSASGLVMQVGGGFDYQSEQYTSTSLDERYKQDSVTRWRASLGIGNIFQGWSLRLQGENLTNERVTVRQGQILKGSAVEGIDAPRTLYATFHYDF
ncbi:TonB-dependent receptor [Spongiibacter sp.]|uniref:TonB-dependent receptor n=1 Tax=Spongiibacter sp. TaxID=2024860 RepID=UPI00356AACD6